MTDAERAMLAKFAHDLVNEQIPALIEAEELRLPSGLQGMVKLVVGALLPSLTQAMNEKIDQMMKAGTV